MVERDTSADRGARQGPNTPTASSRSRSSALRASASEPAAEPAPNSAGSPVVIDTAVSSPASVAPLLGNAIRMKQLSEQYGIPLWMSEYSQSNAFTWASTMHDLISNYNVSAVDYMFGFSGNGNAPMTLKHDGTRYLGYEQNKHYYIIGQFSRFVKPGFQRIQADTTDSAIKVTA